MKTTSVFLMICAFHGSVHADTAMIPASPGVEIDFMGEYGGSTVKEAFRNAGAPIGGADTLRYDSKSSALAINADKATIEYVRALLAEFYSRTPVQRNGKEIGRRLIGKTAGLRNVDFGAGPHLNAIRFEADHVAVGLDTKGARSADFRWAVSSKGDIYIRHADGRLLLTGNLNAPGNLVFTLAKQTKSYDIALQPR